MKNAENSEVTYQQWISSDRTKFVESNIHVSRNIRVRLWNWQEIGILQGHSINIWHIWNCQWNLKLKSLFKVT